MTIVSDTKFEILAVAVASGQSIKSAAESMKMSLPRAYHIAGSQLFKTRVSEIRQAALDEAVGKLNEAANKAVAALVSVLEAGEDRDRIVAAKAVLSLLPGLSELGEIRARLDRLERGNQARVAS